MAQRVGGRKTWLGAMLVLILAGCAAMTEPPAPTASTAPGGPAPVTAILAAGDGGLPVFDNAVKHFRDLLTGADLPPTRISLLSAQPDRPQGVGFATLPETLRAISEAAVAPGGGCLVFLTSHGIYQQGLYLSASNAALTPALLDEALSAHCAAVPSVIIISGCYSGDFAAAPMTRPNRIILTAARRDRTSFGCGAGHVYTFFDECLLGALPESADWRVVFNRVRGCVGVRERQINLQASEPQAYFGRDIAGQPTPWSATKPGTGIIFTPARTKFDSHAIPFPPGERAEAAADFARYAQHAAPKALAFNAAGLVVPVFQDPTGGRNAEDVARLALQRCEWLSGGACTLWAWGDRVVQMPPSGLPPFHPLRLVRDGVVRPETVPFIADITRPLINGYLAMPAPRVLVLGTAKAALSMVAGMPDLASARRRALDHCPTGDCVIYAEDDRVVLGWGE